MVISRQEEGVMEGTAALVLDVPSVPFVQAGRAQSALDGFESCGAAAPATGRQREPWCHGCATLFFADATTGSTGSRKTRCTLLSLIRLTA